MGIGKSRQPTMVTLLCFGILAHLACSSVRIARAQDIVSMEKTAQPAYEVAVIKLSDPTQTSSGFQLRGRRVIVSNETIEELVKFAFGIQARQLVNLPSWTSKTRYDIAGFPDASGEPNLEQMRGMFRTLLQQRFHLTTHDEKRELSVYALRVTKEGSKLSAALKQDDQSDQTGTRGVVDDFRFTANSMADLSQFLDSELDRPTVDETGLIARYDFRLKWAPNFGDTADATSSPSIFTALREELGLKLESSKVLARVLVIDRIDAPSQN